MVIIKELIKYLKYRLLDFNGRSAFSLISILWAEPILRFTKNPNSYYSLLALILALLFVPIMSAFRGYFQGTQNMMPTAISQLFEQVFRAVFGLTLTYVLLDKGIPAAAGGASFGASAGAIEGTIVILFIYLRHRKQINKEFDSEKKFEEGSISKIAKQILDLCQ